MVKRFYRDWVSRPELRAFQVKIAQTDLFIQADRVLKKEAIDYTLEARRIIEQYILDRPEFLTSLTPIPDDPLAPPLIKEMLNASKNFEVGPMASVAGAIAQFVGERLLAHSREVIVENGGDIFASVETPLKISVLYSLRPERSIKIRVDSKTMPISICSSSAKIGHSLSLGEGDLACVISQAGAVSDAAATLACNLIKRDMGVEGVVQILREKGPLLGAILIGNGQVSLFGDLEIIP
jgi:ApbE superfamily uncharacterized protein (UPF0280 family)